MARGQGLFLPVIPQGACLRSRWRGCSKLPSDLLNELLSEALFHDLRIGICLEQRDDQGLKLVDFGPCHLDMRDIPISWISHLDVGMS